MADKENDGKAATFTQEEVEARITAEVAGLKTKNTELLGKLKSSDDRLKVFDGLDPVKARDALTAREQAEADKAKALGDWDANVKREREKFAVEHAAVVDPLRKENSDLRTELFEAVAVRDAVEAMSGKDVRANPKLAMPLIRHELGVELIDGRRVTVVKGADGKPRYHPTTNALVTVADRLKELRTVPDYAGAFEGLGGSGSGAESSNRSLTPGSVTLTKEQAGDAKTYREAVKQAGGYERVKVL